MDKAFLCPQCGAQILLSEAADNVCCFCLSMLTPKDEVQSVDWGFHTPAFAGKERIKAFVCEDCHKTVFASKENQLPLNNCVHCGSRSIKEVADAKKMMPMGIKTLRFIYNREDAIERYLQDAKKEGLKLRFTKKEAYQQCITPLYIPCFLFDYTINTEAVLSVLPIVRNRSKGEGFLNLLTGDDLTLERTSAAEPYPKKFVAEMVWMNVPIPMTSCIDSQSFETISPFSVRGAMEEDDEIAANAFFPEVDEKWENAHTLLKSQVQNWVREYVLSESMDHYEISSYVDNTKYEKALGQLAYIPVWQMRCRHKTGDYSWYMNGLTGVTSGFVETETEEVEKEQESVALKDLNKKKIRNFKSGEIVKNASSVNCRTYMVDTVSSSIMLETSLNESASDKSLFHLERSMKTSSVDLSVPISEAFEKEVDEETKKMREAPIPSAPVPLPTEHSKLYMMKQEIQNRRLGRGERLPEKKVDRDIGGDVAFGYDDITREARAVEVGLSDMPEFDPSGPNPFKKQE